MAQSCELRMSRRSGANAVTQHSTRIRWSYLIGVVNALLLPIWFAIHAIVLGLHYVDRGLVGIDVHVYRAAARTALTGGDPWALQASGLTFAGPPPTLLFYIPTIIMPQWLATVIVMSAGVAAAAWAIRQLDLPIWWLLFPPVVEALLVGNPDVLILALLLVRGPAAGLAAVLKVYAFVPLILQKRWRESAIAVVVSLFTLPLWPAFFSNMGSVAATLDSQSQGYSAWGTWFIVPTVVALWALRRRGAEWLVVPAVWPHTQMHYAAMSLPAVRHYPLAAAVVGLQIPLAAPAAVILMAVQQYVRARNARDG